MPIGETRIDCSDTSAAGLGLNEAETQNHGCGNMALTSRKVRIGDGTAVCIERNRPKPGNVISIGTQNAERHLWDHHKILDPSGRRSAPGHRKKLSTGYQTITNIFNLDINTPREQAILVVERVVKGKANSPSENPRTRSCGLLSSTSTHSSRPRMPISLTIRIQNAA